MPDENREIDEIKLQIAADTRDNRRLLVEEWRLYVQSSQSAADQMRSHAVSYAQIGLNSAFLINGGALVAIPPLMQWLTVPQRHQIPLSASFFLAGLVLAGACSLVTYWNLTMAGLVLDANANSIANQLAVNYGLKNKAVLTNKSYLARAATKKRLLPWIRFTFAGGIACGVASYVMFLTGVFAFIRMVNG